MTKQDLADIADAYYAILQNKRVHHPKCLVLFSGVPGSGKSTIACAIEKELRAIRLSNDEVRDRILMADPVVGIENREHAKLVIATELFERVAREPNGLVVVDASCDRGYDYYRSWGNKHGYRIILLRMDTPRNTVEQRLRARNNQESRNIISSPAALDTWWSQWKAFGIEHTPDLTITPDTSTEEVLQTVRGLSGNPG